MGCQQQVRPRVNSNSPSIENPPPFRQSKELLNVLADLLREALSEEIRTNEEQEENGHES